MAIRITCIKKSVGYHADPHHAISELGWAEDDTGKTGRFPRVELYRWIKDKGGRAYVRDARGNRAEVGTREHTNGTQFVQTRADRVWTDNLLALPECG